MKNNSTDVARLRQLGSDLQQVAHALSSAAYSQAAGSRNGWPAPSGNGRATDDVIDAEFKQTKMMPSKPTEQTTATNWSGLQEQLRTEHEMYLRALADFDNYRRRVERESKHTARSGKREIILSLLEVLDGFDRAFQHAEKNQSALWEGVQAIHRKLLAVLQAQGIAPFESVGQKFDPALHEAIAAVNGQRKSVRQ